MSRDYKLYLKDILQAADYILADISGLTSVQIEKDRVRMQAILYNLMILGEAIKAIPVEYRESHSEVDWRGAAGMRDVLIHQYYVTDLELIWEAITQKLPLLRDSIAKVLQETDETD